MSIMDAIHRLTIEVSKQNYVEENSIKIELSPITFELLLKEVGSNYFTYAYTPIVSEIKLFGIQVRKNDVSR